MPADTGPSIVWLRLVRAALRLLPDRRRHEVEGDLIELWHHRRERGSRRLRRALLGDLAGMVRHELFRRRTPRGTRAEGGLRPMRDTILKDGRDGVRALAASPGLAATALLTLALGIGTSAAVFAVADALLLRALPYPSADRLVALTDVNVKNGDSVNVGLPNFDDWRASVPAVDAAAAWRRLNVNVATSQGADRVIGIVAAGDFFALLGVEPILGRTFTDGPHNTADAPTVVLSERVWRRLSGGATDLVGSAIRLDGAAHEVIGVIANIPGQMDVDLWRPITRSGPAPDRRSHNMTAVARLAPGVSLDEARTQFDVVAARLATAYPQSNAGWTVGVAPLQDTLSEDISQTLWLVAAGATLLLVIACTNVAGLLVVRAHDRRREFAVRRALGAGRSRLVRQLMIECLILSLGAAAAGLVFATWGTGVVVAMLPEEMVLWREPAVSLRVLGFTSLVAVGAGIVFGLAPVVAMLRENSLQHLRGGNGTTTTSHGRLRNVLSGVQFAMASVLLVAAGLLWSSLWRAGRIDPGFDPARVQTFQVTLPRTTHADAAAVTGYFQALAERLAALPQVEAAGAINGLPMAGNETISTARRPDEPAPARGQERWALHQVSTPGYLAATGTRLVEGRDFAATDVRGGEAVTIVNQSLARLLWQDASPVGQTIVLESGPHRVVGMIADVRHYGFDEVTFPQYFVPYAQAPVRALSFAVRTRAPITDVELRQVGAAVDSTVPVYAVRSLESLTQQSLAPRRSLTTTAVFCGVSAMLLSAIGLFGLVASGVRERRREVAIRVALGARTGEVVWWFVRRACTVATIGIAAGFAASVWVSDALTEWLFEVAPLDPLTLLGAAGLLLAVTLVATWLPARRAATISPVDSLKLGA